MDFSQTRTAEMLDNAVGNQERALIAAMASSLEALRVAIAKTVGPEILTERGELIRSAFRLLTEVGMVAVCKTSDDVKQFTALREAIHADLNDIRKSRG